MTQVANSAVLRISNWSYIYELTSIMASDYLFTSERLGFRNWKRTDLVEFSKMNADPFVMAHFPSVLSVDETAKMIERFSKSYRENGYTYYPTELLATGEFIGFIGIALQDYEAEFNPAPDIGWRLKQAAWGQGYATEGATRCLHHAFETLGLSTVNAVCTIANTASERVMSKIGMTKKGIFKHPKLHAFPQHEACFWYQIQAN